MGLDGAGLVIGDVSGAVHRVIGGFAAGERILGSESGPVVLRAAKDAELLSFAVGRLGRGEVVALVPEASGGDYVDEVREQLGLVTRARTAGADGGEGILALPTSGSTGHPKIVALAVSRIERFMSWGAGFFGFGADTVSLSLSPWNFDVSLLDTWAVLAAGGVVVAADPRRFQEREHVAGLLSDHGVTFLQTVPSTLDVVVDAVEGRSFGGVRDVIVTGGVAAAATRRAAATLFPKARFHNVYGSTEVNDCLIYTAAAATFATADDVPLGLPIAGCEVFLDYGVSVQPWDRCPDGLPGELLVRTPWMAEGYISGGEIEPLAEAWGERALYPMRDRVERVGDQLRYLGRTDRTVKLRGQRINLDEIEKVASAIGPVRAACAWISSSVAGDELHLACSQPVNGLQVSGMALRLALSRRLPPYAIPNRLHLLDKPFPLNGNGKPNLERIMAEVEKA
ncbi:hypothetical protein MDOR_11230 [Mycolicibacterium doricum]|uniref:AMP-dependent synthetase/ligase domain-containing protein n=1 Tax=Mycolicibacterium doricum TaxID=126673 RepID=A0A1X1T2S4_9MYCO|nr:AMP-binding protein [Mycolicibacterium doricum]MCV7268658.1 AMP-binding protein [Mycolicibacterium doricum]ORV38663.1 hypothetical protein AWC01_13970 [Mycolicibacterium doricum]BBZ06954.1 hypothetical protein MDOR_11230 [Mycolicibacterium doricum]